MTLTLDAQLVLILSGTILPFLVGLITKAHAASWLKAVLLAVLSILTGILTVSTQMDGTAVLSKDTVIAAVLAWLVAGTAYARLWKPTGATATFNALTAKKGLG